MPLLLRYSCYSTFLFLLLSACSQRRTDKSAGGHVDTGFILALITRSDTISWKQPDSAIATARRAEQLSITTGYNRGVLLSMKSIAKVYIDQALYDSSLLYYTG